MSKFDDIQKNKKDVVKFIDGVKINKEFDMTYEFAHGKLERLNVEIPKELHKAIKMQSLIEERTMKELVAEAVYNYLNK